jgi:hypothetical protein
LNGIVTNLNQSSDEYINAACINGYRFFVGGEYDLITNLLPGVDRDLLGHVLEFPPDQGVDLCNG